MAVNRKPDADRLPISQRIDSRMGTSTRGKMTPTEWAIKGELFLNCSCTVFCPCVVSLGAHPPTEGHCHAWMAIAIDEGHFEGEDLSGLNVGLLVDIPGRMGEGNWKVGAYVDERVYAESLQRYACRSFRVQRAARRGCLPCWCRKSSGRNVPLSRSCAMAQNARS